MNSINYPIKNNIIVNDKFKDNLVKSTFSFTYVFLLTTGTITFIEALTTKNPVIRHIMNVETCISIVAAYFYSVFMDKLKLAEGKDIPYEEINLNRYIDWSITTPLMLLALCMVLGLENDKSLFFITYIIIIMNNFAMLLSGYLGEINIIDKRISLVIGFIFFFIMFWLIWINFMGKNSTKMSLITYYLFFTIWSVYGLIYLADEKTKNITFNILDLIAKAFVGIFFWLYLTKAVIF